MRRSISKQVSFYSSLLNWKIVMSDCRNEAGRLFQSSDLESSVTEIRLSARVTFVMVTFQQ